VAVVEQRVGVALGDEEVELVALDAGAAIIGVLAVAGGLGGSLAFDAPAGPAVAATAFVLFLLSLGSGRARL